jgi:hypothetical protein
MLVKVKPLVSTFAGLQQLLLDILSWLNLQFFHHFFSSNPYISGAPTSPRLRAATQQAAMTVDAGARRGGFNGCTRRGLGGLWWSGNWQSQCHKTYRLGMENIPLIEVG